VAAAGRHVALMGIDGAGKTTVARELVASLRGRGRAAEIVSFKRAMAGGGSPVSAILAHLAWASLKCQYASAVPADAAADLDALLTEDDLGAAFPAAEERLRLVAVDGNAALPFLSSALLEIIGGFWVQAHVESLLAAGTDVIDESYAFKHALKNVLLARRLSEPGSPVHEAAGGVLGTALSLFGSLLQPAHGYWVDTSPRLALRWRTLGGEVTTPF
jgi:hypothetical protein